MMMMMMMTVMNSQVRQNQKSLCRDLLAPIFRKYCSLQADSSGKLCMCVCVCVCVCVCKRRILHVERKSVKRDIHHRYSVSFEAC